MVQKLCVVHVRLYVVISQNNLIRVLEEGVLFHFLNDYYLFFDDCFDDNDNCYMDFVYYVSVSSSDVFFQVLLMTMQMQMLLTMPAIWMKTVMLINNLMNVNGCDDEMIFFTMSSTTATFVTMMTFMMFMFVLVTAFIFVLMIFLMFVFLFMLALMMMTMTVCIINIAATITITTATSTTAATLIIIMTPTR